ncbi:MAG: DMT family transporter [Deltaproteobacteria bacterium]|nr:DMT family transporter [Deltaproteobacteria bacterium]
MYAIVFALVTLSWGGSYLAIRYVVEAMPPLFGAVLRVAITLVCMIVWLRLQERRQPTHGRARRYCIVTGIFSMGVSWGLLFWGERHVAPAVTAILIATTSIFTTLFLPLIDRRRPISRWQWYGVPIGFIGVALVFIPHVVAGERGTFWGLVAVVCAAVCYGIATAMQQPLSRRVSAPRALLWQCWGALACLVPVSWWTEAWPSWEAFVGMERGIWALLYLAICSTVLAFQGWFYLIRVKGSVAASTSVYCVPLVSVLLDAWVLRQFPHWSVLAGAALIFSSVALTQRGRGGEMQKSKCKVQSAKWADLPVRAIGGE